MEFLTRKDRPRPGTQWTSKDAPPVRKDGLQLEERPAFQRRFWTTERSAWLLFGFLLILAVAGLTGGGGPLSRGEVSVGSGQLKYPRFSRWVSADELTVTFGPGTDRHRLAIDQSFTDYFQVEGVQPQPESATVAADGTILAFRAKRNGPASTTLYLRALRPGIARYSVTVNGATTDVVSVILP